MRSVCIGVWISFGVLHGRREGSEGRRTCCCCWRLRLADDGSVRVLFLLLVENDDDGRVEIGSEEEDTLPSCSDNNKKSTNQSLSLTISLPTTLAKSSTLSSTLSTNPSISRKQQPPSKRIETINTSSSSAAAAVLPILIARQITSLLLSLILNSFNSFLATRNPSTVAPSSTRIFPPPPLIPSDLINEFHR